VQIACQQNPVKRSMSTNKLSQIKLRLLTSLILALTGCASTPTGSYYDGYIGSVEPTYLVFRNGRIRCRTVGVSDDVVGSYTQQGKDWVWLGKSPEHDVFIKPRTFGIRLTTRTASMEYMDRYLPRRGFAWLTPGRNYQAPREDSGERR
jgi:hypothetical protein